MSPRCNPWTFVPLQAHRQAERMRSWIIIISLEQISQSQYINIANWTNRISYCMSIMNMVTSPPYYIASITFYRIIIRLCVALYVTFFSSEVYVYFLVKYILRLADFPPSSTTPTSTCMCVYLWNFFSQPRNLDPTYWYFYAVRVRAHTHWSVVFTLSRFDDKRGRVVVVPPSDNIHEFLISSPMLYYSSSLVLHLFLQIWIHMKEKDNLQDYSNKRTY